MMTIEREKKGPWRQNLHDQIVIMFKMIVTNKGILPQKEET